MPIPSKVIVDRIQTFRAAWRELAPDSAFAGMTLLQFEEASSASLDVRSAIVALGKQLDGKKTEKSKSDATVNELLALVVNSVRGTPGFGHDSALYRAFGYVRKSERKSGLSRKGSAGPSTNAA
jgi:hypothetical protein